MYSYIPYNNNITIYENELAIIDCTIVHRIIYFRYNLKNKTHIKNLFFVVNLNYSVYSLFYMCYVIIRVQQCYIMIKISSDTSVQAIQVFLMSYE